MRRLFLVRGRLFLVTAPLAGLALMMIGALSSSAAPLCQTAYGVRDAVKKKQGDRAPGRNICRWGVKTKAGVKKPTTHQKAMYLRQLKRLNAPPPLRYLLRTAVGPAQPPGGALTASVRGNLPACTWRPESGGNYHAYNPSSGAAGKYQIIPSTWAAFGGTRYAPTALQATPAQQDAIAARIAADGLHHWVNC
jgi:hypothetical protein